MGRISVLRENLEEKERRKLKVGNSPYKARADSKSTIKEVNTFSVQIFKDRREVEMKGGTHREISFMR